MALRSPSPRRDPAVLEFAPGGVSVRTPRSLASSDLKVEDMRQ